jgi:hypothetical protein
MIKIYGFMHSLSYIITNQVPNKNNLFFLILIQKIEIHA